MKLRRSWAHCAGVAGALVALAAHPARPQGVRAVLPAPADAAVSTGDLDATERALYAASRRAPREPTARGALGAWLASRGQLRTGAVLLEESRLFGGDPAAIAARLVHLYTWLRDWASLAALPASPLSPGEKMRATVLADRGSEVIGADTVVVPFAPLELGALGRVPLLIGTDTLWAEVDPQAEGLMLPGLRLGAEQVEVFGDDGRGLVAIVREISFGGLTVRNLPARVDGSLGAGRARMGFDVFALLAPTVDSRAGTATLRRSGRALPRALATGLPFVLGFPGVRLAVRQGELLTPITSPAGRAALRGHPWTVDLRRGVIWVEAAR
ncbi:MAG: hypothetical protein AAB224_02390 [Gemmatimonadota bacterium]